MFVLGKKEERGVENTEKWKKTGRFGYILSMMQGETWMRWKAMLEKQAVISVFPSWNLRNTIKIIPTEEKP